MSGKKERSSTSTSRSPPTMSHHSSPPQPHPLPLVVTLNCIEDTTLESDCLAGVASVEHVSLSRLADARIESAAAVLLHSLAFLPRAAQRRLRPWQLILCLGSSDRSVDSALAADLGLNRLFHVDVSRAEEVADTVMALFLGLLRRTHLLSRHALSASGWLGSVQPLCRGMRRCRGLVLGIVGRSASARSLATRSLAFRMSVLYFDVDEGNGKLSRSLNFPSAARRMDTLNDLLAASDLISLHCALTNETIQIINADCLQHIKPGAFLVNTGSSQLLDDCAVKQLLIDGTLAGCALDGADGPQWMEAWVREMPNVLILPRSADYSEEVWMEIREKAISILQSLFVDGINPRDSVSDEEELENEVGHDRVETQDSESALQSSVCEQLTSDIHLNAESSQKKASNPSKESSGQHQGPVSSQGTSSRTEAKRSRSSKKTKRRHARQKSQHKIEEHMTHERESTSHHEDDTAMSGTDQVLSSNSRFASPEDSRSRKTAIESIQESSAEQLLKASREFTKKSSELLKDGFVVALRPRDQHALYVSRQRVQGGAWFLDTVPNVAKRDPAAQFLVDFRSKDAIGLRSFTAGGKLLQINRKMEFVFASHSFDVWESWTFEGSLEECRLVNCRNPLAVLDVHIEILAAVGEDGITRWLD
ncbi:C-terminal binding protein AN [Coffea eugenioides]|uniref:C-terminal binding protein AN-like n=1 Tax=Coffea arabica TaxID=13443 RepID=A0A6P6WII4_COFAR|nr:C-terminal binding protein AN [Coffea eugenioides]